MQENRELAQRSRHHVLDDSPFHVRRLGPFSSSRRVLVLTISLVASIAHPFLLADNRHFAFYLWRRILNVHPFARYILTPAYLFAGRLIYESLSELRLIIS